MLTTLENASYRHAHWAKGEQRHQQEMMTGITNATITIQDQEQLCLAIAAQLMQLVPFYLLYLRIDFPNKACDYWLLRKPAAVGGVERISLPALLPGKAANELLELGQQSDYLRKQQGAFSGQAFEQLGERSPTARLLRDNLGIQSLALFSAPLRRRSLISLELASLDSAGFTPKDCETVDLIMPQIVLAISNSLTSEEVEVQRRLKTAELAVVSAFQNGRSMAEIIPQVALAVNELMPVDLLSLFRVGQVLGAASFDATVQKKERHFVPLTEEEVALAAPVQTPDWQQLIPAREPWLFEPTLTVGPQAGAAEEGNVLTKFYCDLLGLKSSLYMPVLIKGEPVAAIVVANKAASAFTAKDLAALQDLSGQVALALENLLAFERIKALSEHLEQEKICLPEEPKTTHTFEQIIGTSPALLHVFNYVARMAPTDYTVLLNNAPAPR